MSYPASLSASVLVQEFSNTDRMMRRLRNLAAQIHSASLAGPVNRSEVAAFRNECISISAQIVKYSGFGARGLAYASDQLGVTVTATDYSDVSASADQMAEWIRTAIPNGASGESWNQASGSFSPDTFTSAQLAQLRTHIDTLLTLFG